VWLRRRAHCAQARALCASTRTSADEYLRRRGER
jgi:hypothetical protein